MSLTKQQLEALNNNSFPNNNAGAITPDILRQYNTATIDSTVNQDVYTADSASFSQRINSVANIDTASFATTGSNTFIGDQTIVGNVTFPSSSFISTNNVSGNLYFSALNGGILHLNDDGGEGDVIIGYVGSAGKLKVKEDSEFTGSIYQSGTFYADQIDVSLGGIVGTTGSFIATFTSGGVLTYADYQNVATALQPYIQTGSAIDTGSLLTTASFNSYTSSQDFKNTTFATTSSVTALSQSLYFTDTTQSANIATNSSSIGLLQTFSGSQYKNDSSSFNSRINAITGSGGSGTGATTGSNSFTGSQTINGNIILTGSSAEIQNAKKVGIFNSLYNLDYSLAMPIQNTIGYIDELNLPHYYNGGVQPTISASATINNHNLVKVTPQQWFNLTASVGDNHTGILSVEQSTGWNDINNTFGVHGNYVTSGSVNYITQRGLSKIGIFPLGGNPTQPYIGQPIYVDDNGYQLTTGYPSGSRVLRYGYVASFEQTDPMNMYVRQIFVDPVWEKGETITDLNVSSSLRVTGSLNVTGSTNFSELTGSLTSFSASVSTRINNATGSGGVGGATTGSNTFTGQQTLSDVDLLNQITLGQQSGSLVLFGKGFTSSSLSNITASALASGSNIIFKNNNNTAQTEISSSGNIIHNAAAPTATFKRFIGQAQSATLNGGNIALHTLPQISSSNAFPILMAANYFNSTTPPIFRGPASSSAWNVYGNILNAGLTIGSSTANHAEGIVKGLSLTNLVGVNSLTVVANKAPMTQTVNIGSTLFQGGPTTINLNSSSIILTNNAIGGLTINNNASGSPLAVASSSNAIILTGNHIGGGSHTITTSGSYDDNDTTTYTYLRDASYNKIFGYSNAINLSQTPTGSNSLFATTIIGNSLAVTGSNLNPSAYSGTQNGGSAFFGRYNVNTGNRAKSAETIFAVGTGTSTSARKTGFLIDSGSNTFVEGTLNVSGSTTFTGSVSVASTFQLQLPSGSNQQTGLFVLDGGNPGTATISNSLVTANSLIFLTKQSNANSGNGTVSVTSKGSGTFSVTSDHNGDADTVAFMIINPS